MWIYKRPLREVPGITKEAFWDIEECLLAHKEGQVVFGEMLSLRMFQLFSRRIVGYST